MFQFRLMIFILIQLTFSSLFAFDNNSDEKIYKATIGACSKVMIEDIKKGSFSLAKLRMGFFPNTEFNEYLKSIRKQSIDKFIMDLDYKKLHEDAILLRDNPGFIQAINQCYPSDSENDQKMKRFFMDAFRGADRTGKFLGSLTILSTLLASSKIPDLLIKFRLLSELALSRLEKYFGLIFASSLLTRDSPLVAKIISLFDKDTLDNMNDEVSRLLEERRAYVEGLKSQRQVIEKRIYECEQNTTCGNKEELELILTYYRSLIEGLGAVDAVEMENEE